MLSVFLRKSQQTALSRFGLGRSSRGSEIAQVIEDALKLTPRDLNATREGELWPLSRYRSPVEYFD